MASVIERVTKKALNTGFVRATDHDYHDLVMAAAAYRTVCADEQVAYDRDIKKYIIGVDHSGGLDNAGVSIAMVVGDKLHFLPMEGEPQTRQLKARPFMDGGWARVKPEVFRAAGFNGESCPQRILKVEGPLIELTFPYKWWRPQDLDWCCCERDWDGDGNCDVHKEKEP